MAKVVAIVGPTAVGKTALSLRVAQKFGGEVISGDSMQVYRGLDIGTAKATTEERSLVPHHLIDVKDIHDRFSVADFKVAAEREIDQITDRGHLPLVVGGTGFSSLLRSQRKVSSVICIKPRASTLEVAPGSKPLSVRMKE